MRKRNKILLVDDAVEIVKILEALLEANGYEVETAHNGIQALEKLKNHYRPDLIILDMDMPRMGGIAFYHEISNLYDGRSKYPVLVFTGCENLEGFFQEMKVEGFIKKPFEINVLQEQIDNVFDRLYGPRETTAKPSGAGSRTVLVVDEECDVFDRIVLAFMNDGYEVFSGLAEKEKFTVESDKRIAALIRQKSPSAILMRFSSLSPISKEMQVAAKMLEVLRPAGIPLILYGRSESGFDEGLIRQISGEAGIGRLLTTDEPAALLAAVSPLLRKETNS